MNSIVLISLIYSKTDNFYKLKDIIIYSSDAAVLKVLKKFSAIRINIVENKYYLDPIYLIPLILFQLEYRQGNVLIMSKIE